MALGVGDGGSILIKATLDEYFRRGVEQIVFGDGTVWTQADLRPRLLAQASTEGDDSIRGFNTSNTVTGAAGNDTLNGAEGNDTYIYRRGDGHDTIVEDMHGGDTDRLVLEGIDPSDVTLVRIGNDLRLVIAESAPGVGDGGSILIKATLDEYFRRGVEQIVFGDGTIWTQPMFRSLVLENATTAADDSIVGFEASDLIAGGEGNDTLVGGTGLDTLLGGAGDDLLDGGVGADHIDGGEGDDTLTAGTGSSALFDLVQGISGGGDRIVNVENLRGGTGNDTLIGDHAGNRLEGVSGNDTLRGNAGDDTLTGGTGADTMSGGAGNDEYQMRRGDGWDLILNQAEDAAGETDILRVLDADLHELRFALSGNDLRISIAGSTGGATVRDWLTSDTARLDAVLARDGAIDAAAIDMQLGIVAPNLLMPEQQVA